MKVLARTDIRQFSGQQSGVDGHDLAPGAMQLQENMVTTVPGQLSGRRGYALQLWSQGVTTSGNPVIAAYNFQVPLSAGGYVVYHTTGNKVRAALI